MAGDSGWIILSMLFLLQNVLAIKRTYSINGQLCDSSVNVLNDKSVTLSYTGELRLPQDCDVRFYTNELDRKICFSFDPNSKFGISEFRVEYRKYPSFSITPDMAFDHTTMKKGLTTPVCSMDGHVTLSFFQPVYYRKDPFSIDVSVTLYVYTSPANKVSVVQDADQVVSTGNWVEDSVYVMVGCIVGVIAIMAVCIICCCYCCCKQSCCRQTSRGTVLYRGQPQEVINITTSAGQPVPPPVQLRPGGAGYQPSSQPQPTGYATVPQHDNRPAPSAPPLPMYDDQPPPYPGY